MNVLSLSSSWSGSSSKDNSIHNFPSLVDLQDSLNSKCDGYNSDAVCYCFETFFFKYLFSRLTLKGHISYCQNFLKKYINPNNKLTISMLNHTYRITIYWHPRYLWRKIHGALMVSVSRICDWRNILVSGRLVLETEIDDRKKYSWL